MDNNQGRDQCCISGCEAEDYYDETLKIPRIRVQGDVRIAVAGRGNAIPHPKGKVARRESNNRKREATQ